MFRQVGLLYLLLLSVSPVWALGTIPGVLIYSTVNVSYTINGKAFSQELTSPGTEVDELLVQSLVWQDAAQVGVTAAEMGTPLTFLLSNHGNGSDDYRLSVDAGLGGDDFEPEFSSVYLDSDGNGFFDPANDALYLPGGSVLLLAADTSITVFVLSNIPSGVPQGANARVELTAVSNTATEVGTVLLGGGDGGSDVLVGLSAGRQSAIGRYIVNAAELNMSQSFAVSDPFGGEKVVTGAVIRYRFVITQTSNGDVHKVIFSNGIPANTHYIKNTITVNDVVISDVGGEGDFDVTSNNTITVFLDNFMTDEKVAVVGFDVLVD